jgi:hypothetical protein
MFHPQAFVTVARITLSNLSELRALLPEPSEVSQLDATSGSLTARLYADFGSVQAALDRIDVALIGGGVGE